MDIGQVNNFKPSARVDTAVSSTATPAASSSPAAASSSAPVQTAAAVQQPGSLPPERQLNDALQSINKALQQLSPDLQFEVDPDTKRPIVKVVDQQTKEVIRQMPTAEALEISKALDKLQGLLVRQKA